MRRSTKVLATVALSGTLLAVPAQRANAQETCEVECCACDVVLGENICREATWDDYPETSEICHATYWDCEVGPVTCQPWGGDLVLTLDGTVHTGSAQQGGIGMITARLVMSVMGMRTSEIRTGLREIHAATALMDCQGRVIRRAYSPIQAARTRATLTRLAF